MKYTFLEELKIEEGMEELDAISKVRRNKWCEIIKDRDISHSIRKAYSLISLENCLINEPALTIAKKFAKRRP